MLDCYGKMINQISLNSPEQDTLYLDSYFTYSIGHIGLIAYLALSMEIGISPFSRISITLLPDQSIGNSKLLDIIIDASDGSIDDPLLRRVFAIGSPNKLSSTDGPLPPTRR